MKTMAFGHRTTFPPPLNILRPLPLARESKIGVLSLKVADMVGLMTS